MNTNSHQKITILENQDLNYKNKSLKCIIGIKNIEEFIDYAIKMKNENKSIEDILKFKFEFYTEEI